MNKKIAKLLLFKGYFTVGKLKSPRIKYFPLYTDSRKVFSQYKKMEIVTDELARLIKPFKPDLIVSREAAGIPFGVLVAAKLKKNFLYLRKKVKEYNVKNIIEGVYKPGQKVMVVDDAMSTGNDKKKIVKTLEKVDLKVLGIALLLDSFYGPKYRQPQMWLRKNKKYKYIYLVTWPGLMDFAAKQKFLSRKLCDLIIEQLYDPLAWQKKPSNWKKFKELAKKEKNLIFDKSFKDI